MPSCRLERKPSLNWRRSSESLKSNIGKRASRFRRTQPKSCMPSARAADFRREAIRLGFIRIRQTGSHERWIHPDGRAVTIPIHGGHEIGPPLFNKILAQLDLTYSSFLQLKQ